MPRPRVTFSRNGSTSSGCSGPPKETSSRASYGAESGGMRDQHPRIRDDVHDLPPGARPPRRPGVLDERPGRPSPDLDGQPRHRAARLDADRAPTRWRATVSASYLITNALFAVFQARLIDRLGQSRVLPVAIGVFAAGLTAMMAAVEAGRSGSRGRTCAPPWRVPPCRRSAPACGRGGPTSCPTSGRCTPPSRSRRSSTRPCSSSARRWSPCSRPSCTRWRA